MRTTPVPIYDLIRRMLILELVLSQRCTKDLLPGIVKSDKVNERWAKLLLMDGDDR